MFSRCNSSKTSHLRVGLLGPYASRNLGDTAIQMAVIRNLRARIPMIEIIGICPDTDDTKRSLGIDAFPLLGAHTKKIHARYWGLYRIAVFVGSLDLLIVSGGGQLDDFWGGAWGHPFSMFIWACLARLRRVRVVFVGVGLDRLSGRLSRFFAFSAMRLADYRSFRDAGTLAKLKAFGFTAPSHLDPDLAFGLELDITSKPLTPNSEPFVVVNPVSVKTWSANGVDSQYETYLKQLAAVCDWFMEQGLRVHILCSQSSMDMPVAKRLTEIVQHRFSGRIELYDAPTVMDFLTQVCGAELVVASRLHGAILSLVAGVPVVAISPMRKVTQLMDDVGLAYYNVDLQNFNSTDLINRIQSSLDQRSHLKQQIGQRIITFRGKLAQTYDQILGLV